mmetsp:Transcript_41262/g.82612  ORF Transcript_41262/g.82612 Transcript_41262/m.82612 type:complete len:114 (+) Transcript_41262:3-344(+)
MVFQALSHTMLDIFGAQWADSNNGGMFGNNLATQDVNSINSGSYDRRVSGNFPLPVGMTATNFGSAPHYSNLGNHTVYAIPNGARNGHSYPRSEWGREGQHAYNFIHSARRGG